MCRKGRVLVECVGVIDVREREGVRYEKDTRNGGEKEAWKGGSMLLAE